MGRTSNVPLLLLKVLTTRMGRRLLMLAMMASWRFAKWSPRPICCEMGARTGVTIARAEDDRWLHDDYGPTCRWPGAGMIASLSGSVTHQVAMHGVYAVFVLMAIDAVFPAASELVMLFAGALAAGAAASKLSLPGTSVGPGLTAYLVLASAGTIGYVAGSVVGWVIGYRGGRQLVLHHGDSIHLTAKQFERAERWFDRWGAPAVLIGRIIPFVRSFISIPAGIFRMPLLTYIFLRSSDRHSGRSRWPGSGGRSERATPTSTRQ